MSSRPNKRARDLTSRDDLAIASDIASLSADVLRQFTTHLIMNNESAYDDFTSFMSAQRQKEANAPPINFDHLSKSCWKEMNITHARLGPSQQFEMSGEISLVIESAVRTILRGCRRNDKYETRRSGLETMRKIAKSIVLCHHGEIRKCLMNGSGAEGELADGMTEVVEMFDSDEVDRLDSEGMLAKVEEVDRLMEGYGIDAFGELLAGLNGRSRKPKGVWSSQGDQETLALRSRSRGTRASDPS